MSLNYIGGTPMTSFEFDQEWVDFHYKQWKEHRQLVAGEHGARDHRAAVREIA